MGTLSMEKTPSPVRPRSGRNRKWLGVVGALAAVGATTATAFLWGPTVVEGYARPAATPEQAFGPESDIMPVCESLQRERVAEVLDTSVDMLSTCNDIPDPYLPTGEEVITYGGWVDGNTANHLDVWVIPDKIDDEEVNNSVFQKYLTKKGTETFDIHPDGVRHDAAMSRVVDNELGAAALIGDYDIIMILRPDPVASTPSTPSPNQVSDSLVRNFLSQAVYDTFSPNVR